MPLQPWSINTLRDMQSSAEGTQREQFGGRVLLVNIVDRNLSKQQRWSSLLYEKWYYDFDAGLRGLKWSPTRITTDCILYIITHSVLGAYVLDPPPMRPRFQYYLNRKRDHLKYWEQRPEAYRHCGNDRERLHFSYFRHMLLAPGNALASVFHVFFHWFSPDRLTRCCLWHPYVSPT